MVVDLASGDDRRPLVEEPGQRSDQASLALAALTEQHQVVAGQQGAFDFRRDGLVESHDAGQRRLARREAGDEVGADLGLDGSVDVPGRAKLAQGRDLGRSHPFDATCRSRPLPGVRWPGNPESSQKVHSDLSVSPDTLPA
jgi:hypothetical protein